MADNRILTDRGEERNSFNGMINASTLGGTMWKRNGTAVTLYCVLIALTIIYVEGSQ
jgi:hypothetical protein